MYERTIKLDGQEHHLKYSNTAAYKIDKELGYSAMHLLEKIQKYGDLGAFSLSDVATVIWGGMLHKNPNLKVEHVAEMIPLKMDEYLPVVTAAFEIVGNVYGAEDIDIEATPVDESGNPTPDPEKASGTGAGQKK